MDPLKEYKNISWEWGWDRKIHLRITVSKNGDREGSSFLSHSHTNVIFFDHRVISYFYISWKGFQKFLDTLRCDITWWHHINKTMTWGHKSMCVWLFLYNARLMIWIETAETPIWCARHRESYMSAHVLLNVLNELGKRDKMRDLPSILTLFHEFNKLNNTRAWMLDSIYHMTNILKSHFWRKYVINLSLCTQHCYGRHNVSL